MSDRLSVSSVPWMNRTKRRAKRWIVSLVRAAFLIGISFMIIYPLLTKLSLSFMEQVDLYDRTVQAIPKHFTWTNYPEAFYYMKYGQSFLNSVMICGISGHCAGVCLRHDGIRICAVRLQGEKDCFCHGAGDDGCAAAAYYHAAVLELSEL